MMITRIKITMSVGLIVVVAACAAPVPSPATATPLPPSIPTLTPVATATLQPTLMPISSPTVPRSPSATPENSMLAEKGYDIANVQLFYSSPNEVQITFQYRIHDAERAKSHAIGPLLPSSCTDARSSDYPTFFMVPRNSATGEGYYNYTVKSPGGCNLDSFYMVIYSPYSSGRWPTTDAIVYREQIDQPIHVVRDLPAVNTKTLTIDNFAFQATGAWTGAFTFDYSFSPELADMIGRVRFVLSGSGMSGIATCDLSVSGPLIANPAGTYQIDVDLKKDLPANCRGRLDQDASLTYDQIWLSFADDTYRQYIDFDITFKK